MMSFFFRDVMTKYRDDDWAFWYYDWDSYYYYYNDGYGEQKSTGLHLVDSNLQLWQA